ncbi:gliding motility protein GldN [Flavobacterium sp. MFBS3-15]|uniref:type IX secretion system ring protein PorN/GldN n=1 Tax=Flavobacterium sp. MFBS3-15 TaxID=2989816 RepID=UPI0022367A11|nr:gliding motility protein GldN [Flavobacterium sp. MFBS3-15]MCW4469498.1 gliding motility protein GldN [Flavobacterium sp. MFBS3-15]
MSRRILSLMVFFTMVSTAAFAQSNILNAKTPAEIGKKTAAQDSLDNDNPLPYGYVGDRDVLLARKVWERIDLDQRVNFPMYFPVEGNLGPDRKPLYDVLIEAIRDGKITEVYDDSYFTTKKTFKDIEASLSSIDTTDAGKEEMSTDMAAYRSGKKTISEQYITRTDLKAYHVAGYEVVGLWYFDKRQGELKYRMLGISPMLPDVFTVGKPDVEPEYFANTWVYFPAARDVLHKAKAFNERNSAMPITFDHLLNSRRFSGVIYKEENVYGDRLVEDYQKDNSQMQLLEAERIKDKIRNFEQDMWNY